MPPQCAVWAASCDGGHITDGVSCVSNAGNGDIRCNRFRLCGIRLRGRPAKPRYYQQEPTLFAPLTPVLSMDSVPQLESFCFDVGMAWMVKASVVGEPLAKPTV